MVLLENTTAMQNKAGVTKMRYLAVALSLVVLTGCSTIKDMVPSFYDGNQSSKIIDIRQTIHALDCKAEHAPQAARIYKEVEWFEMYSQSRDHRDMLRLIKPLKETAQEFYDRTKKQQASEMYCNLKKQNLETQSARAAKAVMGRF